MRLIDGNHRITRLHRDGQKMFPLFLVPEEAAQGYFKVIRPPKSTIPAARVQLIKPGS